MNRPDPIRLGLLLLAVFAAVPAWAQRPADGTAARVADLVPVAGPQQNLVENLHAEGDTLWAGPELVYTTDGGATFQLVDEPALAPPQAPNARVYSIDAEGEVVWVGLGFRDRSIQGRPQSAAGFAFTTDGGATWAYRFPQLDQTADTLAVYGVSVLPALPIIVPQQSPPFDIDYDPVTRDVWVAGWASGIRKLEWLEEEGTWAEAFERVVLPPDTLRSIRPDQPYAFPLAPERLEIEEGNNFLGFSVLVDETGTVWAGTVAGLNRSTPEDVFLFEDPETGETFEERAWRRFDFDGTTNSLLGDWVISIEEQPLDDPATEEDERNPIWLATWRAFEADERFGITVTRDGGETFEPVLVGERIYDFAFCEPAFGHCPAGAVYAAGTNGLFVSTDDGRTWRSVRDFRDAERDGRFVRRDVPAYAVAVTERALWVGTGDGLLRSTDGGASWTLFRADVPVDAPSADPDALDVEAYAYPNPFSPRADGIVRIRYDRSDAEAIRIFDFAMNLVRTIEGPAATEQAWDGADADGVRVANGVYFYAVEAGGDTLWGKILVLE